MPDITMCPGGACPLRNRCYRFRAESSGRQDYFGYPPFDSARGGCEEFWDIARLAPTEAQIRERAYHLWVAGGRRADTSGDDWQRAQAELHAQMSAELRPGDTH